MSDQTLTVSAATCSKCKKLKPLFEFYLTQTGELSDERCKRCVRERVDAANKAAGRQSMSLNRQEVTWLRQSLRKMLSVTDMHALVRDPTYTRVTKKVDGMAERGAANMANVVELDSRRPPKC